VNATRIVSVGEGMLELARADGSWQLRYGGDTLNTAIHLARLGCETSYLTALGTDPYSEDLRQTWEAEGIDTSLVLRHPARRPGLYAISTDDRGERSFTFWREGSAASRMFDLPDMERALHEAANAQLLYFSLISLAILPPDGRDRLLELARRVRSNGGAVAFDGNYRPSLWSSTDEARDVRDAAIACCDIGLPTCDDEEKLDGSSEPGSIAEHWTSMGACEVLVKLGEEGCFVAGSRTAVPAPVIAVDSSGAGDAFNAGYLAARLGGRDFETAALFGQRLAGWVVSRTGAIPPIDGEAPYTEQVRSNA